MSFLVLAYVALLYLRLGDIFPVFGGWLLDGVAVVLLVAASWTRLGSPHNLARVAMDGYVLALWLLAIVSNVAWGWLGGGLFAATATFPAFFAYFAIRIGVQTERQLERLITLVIFMTLFQAGNGLLQFVRGWGLGGTIPVAGRVTGIGIFNDPNDLATAIVMAMPFVFSDLLGGTRWRKALGFVAGAVLLTGLFLTDSRGGFLAFAVLTVFYVRQHAGRFKAALVGAAVVALIAAAGPSRTASMSVDDSSAQGRVEAWEEGLEMLKARPAFGVGFGQFIEHHDRVAHNSFVHIYAELGLLGGFAFLGLFLSYFQGLRPRKFRRAEDLRLSGVAFIVCALFLSRQFWPPLFVLLAMGACCAGLIAKAHPAVDEVRPTFPRFMKLAFLTASGVILIKLAVVALRVPR